MPRNLGRSKVDSYGSHLNGKTGQVLSVFNVPTKSHDGRSYNTAYAVMLLDDGHDYGQCDYAECLVIVELDELIPEKAGTRFHGP